jgi:Leucine-rich repeat (LRR) protein
MREGLRLQPTSTTKFVSIIFFLFPYITSIKFLQISVSVCAGLIKLTNLRRLHIDSCTKIRSLPEDGLPSSIRELVIDHCLAIKSLPKNGLPSSLQKLHLYGEYISEELKRQCHKLEEPSG